MGSLCGVFVLVMALSLPMNEQVLVEGANWKPVGRSGF